MRHNNILRDFVSRSAIMLSIVLLTIITPQRLWAWREPPTSGITMIELKCDNCGATFKNPLHQCTETKAATCTEEGVVTITPCSFCGYGTMTATTPALGHDFGELVPHDVYSGTSTVWPYPTFGYYIMGATCTEDGYYERKCLYCGFIDRFTFFEIERSASHHYGPGSCMGFPPNEHVLGHDWTDWATVAPTCSNGGYDIRTCQRCGIEEKQNETEPLGGTCSYGSNHLCTICGGEAPHIKFIGEGGTENKLYNGDYNLLTGGEGTTLNAGWYYVDSDITYTGAIKIDGDVKIILGDGATMNIGTEAEPINGNAIDGYDLGDALTIYGQTLYDATAGNLRIYNDGASHAINLYGNYAQYSGTVLIRAYLNYGICGLNDVCLYGGTLDINSVHSSAIFASSNISILGGKLSATRSGSANAIIAVGNITLGWTSPDDHIISNGYSAYGGISVRNGQKLADTQGNIYSGTLTDSEVGAFLRGTEVIYDNAKNNIAAIAGKKNVTLNGRTIYCDDDWNTLCLPFDVPSLIGTPLDAFTVMELDESQTHLDNGTLYLNFRDVTAIKAGKPYIMKKIQFNSYTKNPALTATAGKPGYDTTYGYENLVDGNLETTWEPQLSGGTVYCNFHTDAPIQAEGYILTGGPSTYLPTSWNLSAKLNESDGWTIIDRRDANVNPHAVLPAIDYTTKAFYIQNPGKYQYFRMEVTVGGSYQNIVSLTELSLVVDKTDIENLTNPIFENVTVSADTPTEVAFQGGVFKGTYDVINFNNENKDILFLGAQNTLYYPQNGARIGACRAFFELSDPNAVKEFKLNFNEDDATSLSEELRVKSEESSDAIYNLAGQRLSRPQKGINIINGKKVLF